MVDPKDRYIAAAAEHGRCTESGDYKRGNAAFDRMNAALAELRGRADRGESILVELLNHPNGWVRLDAIFQCNVVAPSSRAGRALGGDVAFPSIGKSRKSWVSNRFWGVRASLPPPSHTGFSSRSISFCLCIEPP